MSDAHKEHDPGGKVRLKMLEGVDGDAEFSDDGKYRYWLSRNWSIRRFSDGRCDYALWIGMNPSVAEADVDDRTIRREMLYTKRMMIDNYIKVNIMDYRSTDPKALLSVHPRSDKNLRHIVGLANSPRCVKIIAAWGSLPKALQPYANEIIAALEGKQLYCMGKTKDGSPRHPSRLGNNVECIPWP